MNSPLSTVKRYLSESSHHIYELPIVMLMPHSACNCRCVMCDIWKGNGNLRQLQEADVVVLLSSFKKLNTKLVVMTGGEALLHPNFFSFCKILKSNGIKVHLLSTGLTLKQHAEDIVANVDEVIVSLDGPEEVHNQIRNIPNAFQKLKEGVQSLKSLRPYYRVTARCVIQKNNFRQWPQTIDAARELGVDQISFLAADVSSHAFNREQLWNEERQDDVRIAKDDLMELVLIAQEISFYKQDSDFNFIAESPTKILYIAQHYYAALGLDDFHSKPCNAPWVSAVIEADGTVRPCFFHDSVGNIFEEPLEAVVNGSRAFEFRKKLDVETNETCKRCVCWLHLK
jgi:MoaA/NifB/PqqE/SkfB family radical SAM enzyme